MALRRFTRAGDPSACAPVHVCIHMPSLADLRMRELAGCFGRPKAMPSVQDIHWAARYGTLTMFTSVASGSKDLNALSPEASVSVGPFPAFSLCLMLLRWMACLGKHAS